MKRKRKLSLVGKLLLLGLLTVSLVSLSFTALFISHKLLAEYKDNINSLEGELIVKNRDLTNQKSQIDTYSNNISKLEAELEILQKENMELSNQLETLSNEEQTIAEENIESIQEVNDTLDIVESQNTQPQYSGQILTPSLGTIIGPSGKETYYNLPMNGVISLMQAAGYNYEYWVRDDGVKMYGDYVMAACGFNIRPRGTIVETSLGTAICADTGTFAESNPTQIDIAVNW